MANQAILTAKSIIDGVELAPLSSLPEIWQQIASGKAKIGHPDPEFLLNLVQLFFTKSTDESAEAFAEGFNFQAFYQASAWKTLEFFGNDYMLNSYPNWDIELQNASVPQEEAKRVVAFVQDVFEEFGYELPSSFYRMLLCPMGRDNLHEAVPMFFAAETQGVKRAYDSFLHSLNVTEVLMVLQTLATRYGFRVQHGCGCDHSLARLIPADAPVHIGFSSEKGRQKAMTAYIWRAMNEYMLFPLGVHSETLAL